MIQVRKIADEVNNGLAIKDCLTYRRSIRYETLSPLEALARLQWGFLCSHLHKGIQDVLVDVFFDDFLAKSLCNQ